MADVANLHVLTEAATAAVTKLYHTVKVELILQKHVESAGGVSKDLQAVFKEARQPLGALLEFMFDGCLTNLTAACTALDGDCLARIWEDMVPPQTEIRSSPLRSLGLLARAGQAGLRSS